MNVGVGSLGRLLRFSELLIRIGKCKDFTSNFEERKGLSGMVEVLVGEVLDVLLAFQQD